jgi:MtaA/CmuA family methyltransferase
MERMTSKERCLAAIHGNPVDRTAVFPLLMFFAANRAKITYRQYATHGPSLAEAQLKMYERFGVDAITACSDAFRISADLGGEMAYPEDNPPYLIRPVIASQTDLRRLGRPDPAQSDTRMHDRTEAVRVMHRTAGNECLVVGWVDMPFAEACSICGISEFMMMMEDDPQLAHQTLEFLTPIVIDFALAQAEAGAAMIGAGDAAASLISADRYRKFALPYEQRVCRAIHNAGKLVKIHICGNTTALLKDMISSGADLFNVDHLVPFDNACEIYGQADKCFKGNLDPVSDFLQATPGQCRERSLACLRRARELRYILSAGCEIPMGVSDETFQAFCQVSMENTYQE